ncbi:MAG: aminoacyl-tRNA hydrolase [Deltaproteobacteria bacterium]|nr:aminoacyl-tRNA hydrolase [Deltaproteobacteria bacterium]
MPDLFIKEGLIIPERELLWEASRSGGPGGQNVNKVASKVELRFFVFASSALPSGVKARLVRLAHNRMTQEGSLLITSSRTRDQSKNLEDVRTKLRELILSALVPPRPRIPTRPSRGSKERRLAEKRITAKIKSDRKGARDE